VILPDLHQSCTGTPLDPSRFPLQAVPATIERAGELWRSLSRGVNLLSPATRERAGRRAVVEALVVALARRGFAAELRPGADLTLRRGSLAVVPARVVAELADGTLGPERYRELCQAWETESAAAEA
jgi:hypothetical protein